MNKPYIYESSLNGQLIGDEAVIVLPDIYSQTDYSKRTAEEFAAVFKRPVFLLDYFSLSTGQANNFNENDKEKVHAIMQNFKGDEFVNFFGKVLGEIKEEYPEIKKFSVVGFCFGGRLSYIAGGEESITRVVSFYGSGANTVDYVNNQSPIEYLISKRKDSDLSVTSFFGLSDPTIPEGDRSLIQEKLSGSGISYNGNEYEAGHAYFQEGRKNYNEPASKASWEVLKKLFK